MKQLIYLLYISFVVFSARCKKFVEAEPPRNRMVSTTVFQNDVTANAALVGIYADMMNREFSYGSGSVTLYAGLAADELTDHSTDQVQKEFYTNTLATSNRIVNDLWSHPYSHIYAANSVIENLERSTGVTTSARQRLTGEAKFIRAFAHFYLSQFFGNAPLILDTDYSKNNTAGNTPHAVLYAQLVEDLENAIQVLPADYSLYASERVRPTRMAAAALLARVHLYEGEWEKAESLADQVIAHPLFSLATPEHVFLKNSEEAIWQMIPLVSNLNTNEARYFILTGNPAASLPGVSLNTSLLPLFENGDQRKMAWIDSVAADGSTFYFPFKYKGHPGNSVTEYYTVLRLAEQYLIRAEARIEQGKIAEGVADLNMLRSRARGSQPEDLPDLSPIGLSKKDALLLLEQERRTELFCEWGHRWFDLKRRRHADAVLSAVKGNSWQETDVLFPIPQAQIQADPAIDQNPGY